MKQNTKFEDGWNEMMLVVFGKPYQFLLDTLHIPFGWYSLIWTFNLYEWKQIIQLVCLFYVFHEWW